MSNREIMMASSESASGGYWISNLTEPSYGVDGEYKYQAIAVDSSGNIYAAFSALTGGSESDPKKGYLVKYNPSGSIIWQINVDTSFNTIPNSLALDSLGNPYLVGYYYTGGNLVPSLMKINTSGVVQWTRYFPAIIFEAIAIDSSDNIYCFGYNQDDPNGYGGNQYLLVKYNSSGTLQWNYLFNQNAPNDNRGTGVAVGSSGNLYVCGDSSNAGIIIKASSAGSILWQLELSSGGIAGIFGIALDSSENIFVCGQLITNQNAVVAKFDSSGGSLWSTSLGNVSANEYGNAIAVDAAGYVYVTGFAQTGGKVIIFKLNGSDGSVVWQKSFSYSSTISGFGIKTDSSGNMYVYMTSPSAPYFSIVAKLPNNGYPYGTIGPYSYVATTYSIGGGISATTPSPLFTSIASTGSSSSATLTSSSSSIVNTLTTI